MTEAPIHVHLGTGARGWWLTRLRHGAEAAQRWLLSCPLFAFLPLSSIGVGSVGSDAAQQQIRPWRKANRGQALKRTPSQSLRETTPLL